MSKPFVRVPFSELPALPSRPHADAQCATQRVQLSSSVFGSHEVHVRTLGDGPPLLLLHGLMTTGYSWRYVIEPLSRHFRVIAPDLPGAGESDKVVQASSFSSRAFATWILEFQRAMKIEKCLCVGNSMGGYLAMMAALQHQEAFSALVNIHSPAISDVRYHALSTALSPSVVKKGFSAFVRRDPFRWVWRNVHYYDESLKSREELEAYGRPLQSHDGATAFIRFLQETMSPSGFDDLAQQLRTLREKQSAFPAPLLLLYSCMDPLVPPRNGHWLGEQIPSARLHWLDHTSHFAHVDSPQRVLEVIEPFLLGVLHNPASVSPSRA